MATYKRRIVYLSDTEWAVLAELAAKHGETISSQIRRACGFVPSEGLRETPAEKVTRSFVEHAVDFENAVVEVGNSMRSFRPVPKPIRRK